MTKIKQMCRTLTVKEKNKNGGHATCGPSSRMKWGVNLTDDRCTKTQKKWGKNDINELERG
jgi:hypothetical protein